MTIYDQLGEVRSETYLRNLHSEGQHNKPGTNEPYKAIHAQAKNIILNGEAAVLVRAEAGSALGETALFAAYVEHTVSDPVIFSQDKTHLKLANLAELTLPYMSDQEVEQRFDAIAGTGLLTAEEKRQIIYKALLLKTHFNLRLQLPGEAPEASLQFDDPDSPENLT